MTTLTCQHCSNDFKFPCRLIRHESTCLKNPNKPPKKLGNQYTKAKELGLPKPIVKQAEWTAQRRAAHGKRTKEINAKYWADIENVRSHALKMQEVVKANPDSYSKNNVSGRAKIYDVIDSYGPTKVKGTWELAVANWLNDHSVKWTNTIAPYSYFWNNGWHHYFPDFELIDLNILIEVKGYQTDRDLSKWASVKDKPLIVIRKEDLKDLKKFFAGIQAIGQSHKLGPEVSNTSPATI